MTLYGRIEKLEGSMADVCLTDESCGHDCSTCAGCSKKTKGRMIKAENTAGAAVGDNVVLKAPTGKIAVASFLVFFLPVLLTVGGYVLGRQMMWSRPFSLLAGIIGLVLGVGLCALYSRSLKKQADTVYTVESIQWTEE